MQAQRKGAGHMPARSAERLPVPASEKVTSKPPGPVPTQAEAKLAQTHLMDAIVGANVFGRIRSPEAGFRGPGSVNVLKNVRLIQKFVYLYRKIRQQNGSNGIGYT